MCNISTAFKVNYQLHLDHIYHLHLISSYTRHRGNLRLNDKFLFVGFVSGRLCTAGFTFTIVAVLQFLLILCFCDQIEKDVLFS